MNFLLVLALVLTVSWSPSPAQAATVANALCPGEDVQFNPGNGDDILVPPGYQIEVFAKGLNFPTNIAFKGNQHQFEVYVTEAGTSLPGICNAAVGYPGAAADNPFLADVRVLNQNGQFVRVLGRAPTVAAREDPAFLHAPTIGIAFEHDFNGGRLFVSDSRQGIRGALGPKNSSRILEVNPTTGQVTERITGLPTGDHPTEQLTVMDGWLVWSQGSVTNSGVVGHDNTGPGGVGGPPDVNVVFQHEIPCQDVVLSGNNFDSGDGHNTGGYLPHGVAGASGQVVHAFTGATQVGMCTGAILAAQLSDLQHTIRPISYGYRNPFGIRFAPHNHPLGGALLITENGEDERGARPTNNSPDRLQVWNGGLDYHGWPDRFGFLASTQSVFNPVGGPADDNPAAVVGKPVRPLLRFPPQRQGRTRRRAGHSRGRFWLFEGQRRARGRARHRARPVPERRAHQARAVGVQLPQGGSGDRRRRSQALHCSRRPGVLRGRHPGYQSAGRRQVRPGRRLLSGGLRRGTGLRALRPGLDVQERG